jgi:hypothetical protein
MHSYPYSNILALLKIRTGSGGGGNDDWSSDVKIFLADWPILAESLTFNKLAGRV